MKARVLVPPGTPEMVNPEVVTACINPDTPELCPACGHATLYRFTATVLHDAGAVELAPVTACGSAECDPEG